jgi:hypothetical protein
VWQHAGKLWGVEFKFADAPRITRSMRSALEDLGLSHLWVVYPGSRDFPLDDRISARALASVGAQWEY